MQWKETLLYLALMLTSYFLSGLSGAIGVLSGWVAQLINRRLLLGCCFRGPIEELPKRLRKNAALRFLLIAVVLGASANIKLPALIWAVLTLAFGQSLWFISLWRFLTIQHSGGEQHKQIEILGGEGGIE